MFVLPSSSSVNLPSSFPEHTSILVHRARPEHELACIKNKNTPNHPDKMLTAV